ncbi:MAG: EAL domain-containing protein [Caldicoprobacterales bacterium]
MAGSKKPFKNYNPVKAALQVSLAYAVVGMIWILFSDKIMHDILIRDPFALKMSTIKGSLYVIITGILLFVYIMRVLRRIQAADQALLKKNEELIAIDQELQEKIKELTESEERYRLISEATNDGIWDEKEGKRFFSERWYEITGYTEEDIERVGDWMALIHPEDIGKVRQKLSWHKQNRDPYYECEYRLKFKDGKYRWILSKSKLIFDHKGEIIRSAGSHSDITDLKISQERLKGLAYRDFLTGMPNRISFIDTVTEHILKYPDKKKALIFFDIDNFKHINDTVGYLVGDQLIIAIGQRLSSLSDANKSAYRNSGDEFVIFIHEYEDIEEVENFTRQLIRIISQPFVFSNYTLNINISIGIALYPLHGKDIDTLFKCADIAMFEAKSKDRGRYIFYHESMEAEFKERMLLGNELRGALERNEFQLHYQPQLNIDTGEIFKFEALLRWHNERFGNVPPIKFIEIAEETHLINPIGDWVLNEACSFLKELHKSGFSHISISINVSIIQLMQHDFVYKVIETLKRHQLDPRYLEVEVTESVFIESYEDVREKLELLSSRGISIALDDFGSGYSSLNYLIEMPINTLKIDKSFIHSISENFEDQTLASMIIMLGQKLGLSVIAEGVETKDQVEYLEKLKCYNVQGYYFSGPVPREEVFNLLNREKIL